MTMAARTSIGMLALLSCGTMSLRAHAQGQDSTPGQRNLLIMAELLPGIYDTANQNYFDTRRVLPEAARRSRIESPRCKSDPALQKC